MEMERLELLENKINQAVQLIQKLKNENLELQQQNQELREETISKDRMIEQLKEENQKLQQLRFESSLGKEKEEKIKNKVEQMLSRLDELQLNL